MDILDHLDEESTQTKADPIIGIDPLPQGLSISAGRACVNVTIEAGPWFVAGDDVENRPRKAGRCLPRRSALGGDSEALAGARVVCRVMETIGCPVGISEPELSRHQGMWAWRGVFKRPEGISPCAEMEDALARREFRRDPRF
ncbi:MAG: hypothetical protein IPP45_06640, partial [Sphingomonadales bacterium]|nr:hypothetical protein [Sphingomonadales bacterium]